MSFNRMKDLFVSFKITFNLEKSQKTVSMLFSISREVTAFSFVL